jgi:hypothetical protein
MFVPFSQAFAASSQPTGELVLNAFLGYAQPCRHFALWQQLQFSEDDNFAASLGEGIDRLNQEFQLLGTLGRVFRGLSTIQDALIEQIPTRFEPDTPTLPNDIDRKAAGHREEKCLRRFDRMPGARFPYAQKRFLDDIIHIPDRRKRS